MVLSGNTMDIARQLKQFISANRVDDSEAKKGIDYYNGKHDILKNKIYWIDENGTVREDKNASNIRIPHAFMTEQVDQKVQFLLSNPVNVEADESAQGLQDELDKYYDADFNQTLQDLLTSASQKGFEYLYAQVMPNNRIGFIVADGLKIIPISDDKGNVQQLLRCWQEILNINGRKTTVRHAELYDQNTVTYFIAHDNGDYTIDDSVQPNPRPHVINIVDNGGEPEITGRGLGRIPFFRFKNTYNEETDLKRIKELIDDYDLMNAFMSNNLQDMSEAIYVLNGEADVSTDEMRMNIKAKKAVITGGDGNTFDLKTFTIPTEARKTKMDIDRENIYKFGMAVDSLQTGDGNITNVVIKSRYELLNMKVNKLESRVKQLLKWVNELVIADINRINGTSFTPEQVEFTLERNMLINEQDQANIDKLEADTLNVNVQALLSVAPYIDSETLVTRISELFDFDKDAKEITLSKGLEEYGNDGIGAGATD